MAFKPPQPHVTPFPPRGRRHKPSVAPPDPLVLVHPPTTPRVGCCDIQWLALPDTGLAGDPRWSSRPQHVGSSSNTSVWPEGGGGGGRHGEHRVPWPLGRTALCGWTPPRESTAQAVSAPACGRESVLWWLATATCAARLFRLEHVCKAHLGPDWGAELSAIPPEGGLQRPRLCGALRSHRTA